MKKKKLFLVLVSSFLIIILPNAALADISPSDIDLPIVQYSVKFLLTILIETLAIFIIFKTIYKKQEIKNIKLFLAGVIPSLITLPIFYFLDNLFFNILYPAPTLYDWYANNYKEIPYTDYRPAFIIVCEILIFIFEAFVLCRLLKIPKKQALIVSFVANLLSFLLGTFLITLLR